MMGKPYSLAFARASSASFSGWSEPGMVGTRQALAMDLAVSLSPIWARIWEEGPIKVMPASSQALAKSAFSDKKP